MLNTGILDGVIPEEAGCTKGRVFNPGKQQCDEPENVRGKGFFYFEVTSKFYIVRSSPRTSVITVCQKFLGELVYLLAS